MTAGTGVIEEGSYICDLLNTTSKPIVWTGAQFSANMSARPPMVDCPYLEAD